MNRSAQSLDDDTAGRMPPATGAGAHERPPAAGDEGELPRRALDKLSAMVAYWDADLRCRFANLAYKHWFGVTPGWLLGRHIRELLGPLYELNLPYIQGALRGEPQEFEREIPDPRGGPARHSLANYMPDVVDGQVRGFFVLVTDISAVKNTERALRQAQERLRLTLDEAPIGMAVVGPDGHFLQVNRALCDMLGYASGELVGMTFQQITHPDDLDADLALARQLASGEIPRYTLEKRYIRKDGSPLHVLLSGSVLRGPDGQPLQFIAQVQDISARKRMEQQQQFLAELGPVLAGTLDYEETLRCVAERVVRSLADFCVVDVLDEDEGVRRVVVTSRDPAHAALAQRLKDVRIDRSQPCLVSGAMESQRPVLLQRPSPEAIRALAQTGEHLRVLEELAIGSVVAAPLLAGERLVGCIAMIASRGTRDLDGEDVRLAEELAWRTALSIQNARLYRAARKATQARDDVLAIVAHDLRNPLNTIGLHAAMMRRRAQPRAGAEGQAAEMIQRASARMNRLIEDLLDVSRLEAGRLAIDAVPVPAGALLADCLESQGELARSASLQLLREFPDGLPAVLGDRDRLLQVFENLVGNAVKFTAPGGQVGVGAQPRSGEVLFWVRDTGSGIPAEQLPHVFDRFWQPRRADRQGAGLGLAIAKGVVEAHGGRIWVESTPGQGSRFCFTVPTAAA